MESTGKTPTGRTPSSPEIQNIPPPKPKNVTRCQHTETTRGGGALYCANCNRVLEVSAGAILTAIQAVTYLLGRSLGEKKDPEARELLTRLHDALRPPLRSVTKPEQV